MAEEKKNLPEEEAVVEGKTEVAEESTEAIGENTTVDEETTDDTEEGAESVEEDTEADEEVAESVDGIEETDDVEKTESAQKPKKTKLIVACVVIILVIAGVVTALLLTNGSGNKQPETTALTETASASETNSQVLIAQEKLNKIVYSSQIGKVEGKLYAVIDVGTQMYEGYYRKASEKPVIPGLPVETEGYITSFAQYGDYVYYVATESYEQQSTYTLYKCKTDFTGSEQIFQCSYSMEGSWGIYGSFVIDNGKLFGTSVSFGEEEARQYQCIDLATKEVTDITPQDYKKLLNISAEEKVDIFNGKVIISKADWNKDGQIFGYVMENGNKKPLTDETIIAEFCGKNIVGFADDCVYYTEIFNAPVNGANGKLKSYNLTTGEIKILDQRLIGGTSDYFQSYEEIVEE